MGDLLHKKDGLRYALPRLGQRSTKAGLAGLALGVVAVLFGADAGLADMLAHTVGGLLAGAGAHAALVDDGSA